MWELIQGKPFDVRAFADRLERNAQEYVKWERLKLQWLLAQEEKSEAPEESRNAA